MDIKIILQNYFPCEKARFERIAVVRISPDYPDSGLSLASDNQWRTDPFLFIYYAQASIRIDLILAHFKASSLP